MGLVMIKMVNIYSWEYDVWYTIKDSGLKIGEIR